MKVCNYQASEVEPNPSVFAEKPHSIDWKQCGEVSTNFNPYWIQLPSTHFFRIVAHHKSGKNLEVLQQSIHPQQKETIGFDF